MACSRITLLNKGNQLSNSSNHDNKGQNVAWGDTHVEFQTNCYTYNGDNMFTTGPVTGQAVVQKNSLASLPGTDDFCNGAGAGSFDGTLGP